MEFQNLTDAELLEATKGWSDDRELVTCDLCGAEFVPPINQGKSKRHYCAECRQTRSKVRTPAPDLGAGVGIKNGKISIRFGRLDT